MFVILPLTIEQALKSISTFSSSLKDLDTCEPSLIKIEN